MFLTKLKNGNYSPVDDSDFEASKKIAIGDIVKAVKSRNPLFHKKAFKLISIGFENQDRYDKFEVYRKVLTVRAGYYDEVEIKQGEVIPQAQSLSFESMSAEVFEKWYNDVLMVISEDMKTAPETIQNELNSFF